MLYEGMMKEEHKKVKAVRDRYDRSLRQGISYGPGGNPFKELSR